MDNRRHIETFRLFRVSRVVLLCLCVVYLIWPITTLEVRSGLNNGVLKLSLSLSPGHDVTLGFVHSLYKVVQEERYVVKEGSLQLSSVFFGSFDALNYYDPLEILPRKKIQGGYEVTLNPPIPLPVYFATAHSTKMWLKVDDDPPILLEPFIRGYDAFSLNLSRWPRVVAGLVEVTHG